MEIQKVHLEFPLSVKDTAENTVQIWSEIRKIAVLRVQCYGLSGLAGNLAHIKWSVVRDLYDEQTAGHLGEHSDCPMCCWASRWSGLKCGICPLVPQIPDGAAVGCGTGSLSGINGALADAWDRRAYGACLYLIDELIRRVTAWEENYDKGTAVCCGESSAET